MQAFNGASDVDSAAVTSAYYGATDPTGYEVTPPDQGLCVGHDALLAGNPAAVFEPVNLVVRETSPSGAQLRPDTFLQQFFNDQLYASDPRCFWDPSTQSFYFTDIGANINTFNYALDVAVLNHNGFATYQFDMSEGGQCLSDQPKTGFDNNALVVSTDQYCNDGYEGALVLAISKSQLAAEDSTVNTATLGPVSLGGVPVTGLDPAINTGTGTSYFVNSFPYTASGYDNAVSSALGVWTLTGDAAVTTGSGTITLTGKAISSQQYAFPVPAMSTGNGVTVCPVFCYNSETVLNPDDSRISGPVSVSGAGSDSSIRLWTALPTAVSVPGNPNTLDGAAWFVINPGAGKVQAQGIVAANNQYLLYPAVGPPASGNSKNFADMVFTLSSATLNPSSAYTTVAGGPGGITVVANGITPHTSFASAFCPTCFGRWGDYSFAAPDPSGSGVWLATEYIPPLANQDPIDNWGTSVFELSK